MPLELQSCIGPKLSYNIATCGCQCDALGAR